MGISKNIECFIPSEKLVKMMLKHFIAKSPADKGDTMGAQIYVRQCIPMRLATIAFRAIAKWSSSETGHISGIKIHSAHGGIFVLEELEANRVIIRISKNEKFTYDMAMELANKLELSHLELKTSEIDEIMILLYDELANFINNDGDMSGNWGKLKIDSMGMYIKLLKYRPRRKLKKESK